MIKSEHEEMTRRDTPTDSASSDSAQSLTDRQNEGRSEETKNKLIESAATLVADRGWNNASTRAIAESAGVNLALVNYHFGSKNALLLAALDWSLEQIDTQSEAQHESRLKTKTKTSKVRPPSITDYLENIPELAQSIPIRVLYSAMIECGRDEEVQRAVQQKLAQLREWIAETILGVRKRKNPARQSGEAILIAALFDGLMLHCLIDPETDLEACSKQLRRWNKQLISNQKR